MTFWVFNFGDINLFSCWLNQMGAIQTKDCNNLYHVWNFIWDPERCLWGLKRFLFPAELILLLHFPIVRLSRGDGPSKIPSKFNVLQHWGTGIRSSDSIEQYVTRRLNRQGMNQIDPEYLVKSHWQTFQCTGSAMAFISKFL